MITQKNEALNNKTKLKFYQKKWFKIVSIILAVFVVAGGVFAWKTGSLLNKISGGGIISSLIHSLPGVEDKLKGEDEGRVNVLFLGMRGEHMEGGGLLADTIMVASIRKADNKVSLISIPRDLYVNNPGGYKSKINAVYAFGEENGKGEGLEEMKKIASEVTGLPIHYGASINFEGFKEVVDSLGGVQIHLDSSFSEPVQFMGEPKRCDNLNYVTPTGKYESKKVTRKNGTYYFKEYPLCYPKTPSECGGNFTLEAGDITLDGEQALCYVRSRATTSDFDRARRQQLIIQKIKDKALSLGTLSDFGKVNDMLNALGNNAKTDMQLWEMKRMFELYQGMTQTDIIHKVLENSEEGLLYAPEQTPETGYILLPRGENYDRIHEMAKDILGPEPVKTEQAQ